MDKTVGRRGPYTSGIARREEIVDAALEIFAARSYDAVSLREIAAKVGISHTGLRHHFESKEHLLTAVLRHKDEATLAPDPDHAVSGLAWLHDTVEVVRRNAGQPLVIRLFATLSTQATDPGHPAHVYFVNRYRVARELFARHLEVAREAGDLRSDIDVDRVAQTILATMDGLQVQWLLNPEAIDMVEAYREFLDDFLGALAT